MKCWRGLDLGAQVRRGPEQEPGIPVGADSNLSLAARLAAKTSGAKSTAVAASTIPLRKCAAGRRTKDLHAHGASLAAHARSLRFLTQRNELNPISCSVWKGLALLS